jgi:hypothetical protein
MGLLNSIGSLIFGGQKKTTSSKTQGTTQTDPWDVTIPYLNDYLSATKNLYGTAPAISPYEQQGYDALSKVAGAGGTATNPAIAANNKTLSGSYLTADSNPYIADIAARAAGLAGANSSATFGGSGRTGSGLAGYYAGKGAADAANSIFYQNYGDERNRMLEASGQAPQLEAARYLAPQALISAGQNISARPFDLNAQQGGILSQIAQLGQQGQYSGLQKDFAHNPGIIGTILNSFTNKLFPNGSSGPF